MKIVYLAILSIVVPLIFFGAFSLSNTNNGNEKITVAYQSTIFGLPIFIAQDKGFFKDEGLDVDLVRIEDNAQHISMIVAGKVDVAQSSIIPVFSLEATNPGQIKIILASIVPKENSGVALVTKNDSSIRTLADLEGKKIGIYPGSIYAKMMVREITKSLFNPDSITFVELAPQLQAQALVSGQVDALYTFEPMLTISVRKFNARIVQMIDHSFISDPYSSGGILIPAKLEKERPQIAAKIKNAISKSVKFLEQNPAESYKLLTKYAFVEPQIAENLIGQLAYVNSTQSMANALQKEANSFAEKGIIQKQVDVSPLVS